MRPYEHRRTNVFSNSVIGFAALAFGSIMALTASSGMSGPLEASSSRTVQHINAMKRQNAVALNEKEFKTAQLIEKFQLLTRK